MLSKFPSFGKNHVIPFHLKTRYVTIAMNPPNNCTVPYIAGKRNTVMKLGEDTLQKETQKEKGTAHVGPGTTK